jgi:hypothetical protein
MVGLAIIAVVVGLRYGPIMREWATLQYEVRVRAATRFPPNHIAISFDKQERTQLAQSDTSYQLDINREAAEVAVFNSGGPFALPGYATLFSGWRTTPGGEDRLVVVSGDVEGLIIVFGRAEPIIALYSVSYPAPNWNALQMPSPCYNERLYIDPFAPYMFGETMPASNTTPRHRFFSGQVDPTDPSKFSIHFTLWGQPDVIDGQLLDGGHVVLSASKATLFVPHDSGLWLPID